MSIALLHGAIARGEKIPSEAEVKAAFLFNFPNYIEWPPNSFGETNQPVVVAIYGDEKVSVEFSRMIVGKKSCGHPIRVKQITSEEECAAGGFHILFIGASERRKVIGIISRLRESPVLTVGETDDFIEKGGMINLVRDESKVRLQVNVAAAHKAQLKISAKLLKLALVKGEKPN